MRQFGKWWFTLAVLIAGLVAAAPARAEWRVASSEHFVIYADADADEAWLRNFATRLERFDAGLRRRWGLAGEPTVRSNRLTIYVVDSYDDIERLAGGEGVAGFYIPRAGGSVAFTPRHHPIPRFAEMVLFHEYTHHFLLLNFPAAYPLWFSEGFAEFHSTAEILPDGSVRLGRGPQHRAEGIYTVATLSIERLLGIQMPPYSQAGEADAFYGRAWLLMHMLSFDEKRRGQLTDYVRRINSGVPIADAARQTFGDLRMLRREMDSYVRQSRLTAITMPAAALPVGEITIRALSEGHARMMPWRMQSDRGVNARQATALVAPARRVAAAYPNDAAVQAALAEIEFDAKNLNEAEAAADRAIAADARNMDALLYKGRVLIERAAAAGAGNAQLWSTARNWFIRANAIDADSARPLYDFYRSFRIEGRAPTANAIAALARAFELSPHDPSVRMTFARQLLESNEPARARRVLETIAYSPHRRSLAEQAQRLIARIDAGEAAPAIAAGIDSAAAKPPRGS